MHPGVEVIARDRGGLYAEGAAQGAPAAIQVADRFHLVLNLSCAVERVLEERSRELVLPAPTPPEPPESPLLPVEEIPRPGTLETQQLQRRQRRLDRYQQVIDLHDKGYSQQAIERELNIQRKTVRRASGKLWAHSSNSAPHCSGLKRRVGDGPAIPPPAQSLPLGNLQRRDRGPGEAHGLRRQPSVPLKSLDCLCTRPSR